MPTPSPMLARLKRLQESPLALVDRSLGRDLVPIDRLDLLLRMPQHRIVAVEALPEIARHDLLGKALGAQPGAPAVGRPDRRQVQVDQPLDDRIAEVCGEYRPDFLGRDRPLDISLVVPDQHHRVPAPAPTVSSCRGEG